MDNAPIYTPPPASTVTYWAISDFNSKTIWVGAATVLFGILTDPDLRGLLTTLIPLTYLPRAISILGIVIIVLRKFTERPVRTMRPFATMPVEVAKLGPPPPPVVTD